MWLIQLSWLTTLNDSDAAGNGLTQGLSAVALVFLWVLLAVLMLIAALGGDMPGWTALAAVVSGYAALVALNLLGDARGPSFHWPIAEPALVPPLIVALSLWATMPPLRRAVPAWLAGGGVWGAVTVPGAAVIAAR